MKAIIIAGGKGTRLRPLTCTLPKPMIPVMNIPIMEHIILLLKKHGFTDIGVTLMYLPQKIQHYFSDGSKWGVHLTYFTEKNPLGTAGSLRSTAAFIDDTFLVINADCITDINLTKAMNYHLQKKVLLTMGLTLSKTPWNYGVVELDSKGFIKSFHEKPSPKELSSNIINTGIYIVEPEILQYIETGRAYDFGLELFPKLLRSGVPILGYLTPNYWADVGQMESFMQTHRDILDQKSTALLHKKDPVNIAIGKETVIDPTAVLQGPLLVGDNCYIGSKTCLDSYTVIGNDCNIEGEAYLKRCIVLNHVSVGYGVQLNGCIVGNRVRLGRYVRVQENAVISDDSLIQASSVIAPNRWICTCETNDSSCKVL